MKIISNVDETINKMCDWIQGELADHDGCSIHSNVAQIANATAALITARVLTDIESEEEDMITIACECGKKMHGADADYCGDCGKRLEK